jgi:HicB-like protein involved in pilus formation
MQLEPHVEALRAELARLADLGDENVAAAATRLSEALGATLSMRLLGLLSEAALEISSQLPAGHVELRLAGEEPSLVYVSDEAAAQPAQADDALTARITLRLPDSLKTSLEAAAAQDGVSLNSWIVKALARGLTLAATSRIGSRLTGFGQS